LRRFLLSLILACPLFAGQYAVLQNGFRIYADRHEDAGEMVRLHTSSGTVEIPKKDIATFEVEEYVRPAAPPAQAAEPVAAPAAPPASPKQIVSNAAATHGLRPEFVRSIAAVESAYKIAAVSPKGAIGLMQLMPGTAKELGVNPHVPEENADGGTRYLKELLLKYANHPDGVRLAIAAYNAGPGAVDKYGRRIPPYRETQAYVEKVVKRYMAELKAAGQS
jgi:soluble lytic murein transglycosylase-like protein